MVSGGVQRCPAVSVRLRWSAMVSVGLRWSPAVRGGPEGLLLVLWRCRAADGSLSPRLLARAEGRGDAPVAEGRGWGGGKAGLIWGLTAG